MKIARHLIYFLLFALLGGTSSCKRVSAPPSLDELRPLLNSERIERIFGSYGIEVLEREPYRVSNLYSQDNEKRICRTLAIVMFSDSIPEELSASYQEIQQGASLGATLKKMGWTVEKRHQYFGEIQVGKQFRELAGLGHESDETTSALHIYALWAAKGNARHLFSTIAEVHNPQYLSLVDLKEIYVSELEGNLDTDASDLKMIAIAESVSK